MFILSKPKFEYVEFSLGGQFNKCFRVVKGEILFHKTNYSDNWNERKI